MATSKVHYRVCHMCGEVNHQEHGLVGNCSSCGKHLAPFYYFDESRAMGLTDPNAEKPYRSSALPHQEYPPIWGLTVYWELDS